jgi:hypothetical protein
VRFEATVHPRETEAALERVADLDLDRVPDPEGAVRVLVTAEDAARLVAQGYEVRLVKAHEVRPLDPAAVIDDAGAQAWLEEQTKDVERPGGA